MKGIIIHLQSGWFAITTPVVGQMCHIKEVRYWFCFPVKHLMAVRGNRQTKRCLRQALVGLRFHAVGIESCVCKTPHRIPPYHALSLKEMGAVPGGAFKAFWEPVYRMSISGCTIRDRLHHTSAHGSRGQNWVLHRCLTLLVHKNWCCSERCNCVHQEEAVVSAVMWQ